MSDAALPFEVDDRRLAFHEAGHVLVGLYHGVAVVGPVSIRPRHHWLGIAIHTGVPAPPGYAAARASAALSGLMLELPPEVRAHAEREMQVALGGFAGEALMPQLSPAEGGPVSTGIDVNGLLEEAVARRPVAPLDETERALLELGDDVDLAPPRSDMDVALELALALAGPRGADPLIRLQIAEAERLLEREEILGRRLSRLAGALLEHRELSTEAITALTQEDTTWHLPRLSRAAAGAESSA